MTKRVKRESSVEAELIVRVRALGGLCEKVQVIGKRGFFDRLVILPGGVIIFVELKRPRGGKLSPGQLWYAARFNELDVAIAVVRDSEDIARVLAMGRKRSRPPKGEERPAKEGRTDAR